MFKKESSIFKPGPAGKFFYWLAEILNFLCLIIFNVCLIILSIMYFWAMIDESSVPIKLFTSTNGLWSFFYQFQSIAGLLFLWLFLFMLKKNAIDLFSAKERIIITIDNKGINRTGHRAGVLTYYITGGINSFAITQKAYEKLNVGQTVEIAYTKAQRNVRMITLLK